MMLTKQTTESQIEERFVVRPPTMDDIDAAVSLLNRCSIAQTGQPDATPAAIRMEWETPRLNMAESLRSVFTEDGQMIGYIEVWDLDDKPVNVWVWGRVDPDFEGQGIGSYLMAWAEQRAQRAVKRVPDEARVTMRSATISSYQPAQELLRDRNMTLIRHFYSMKIEMDAPPPQPVLAQRLAGEGSLVIRTLAETGDRLAVYRAQDEAFMDHWGYVQQPEETGYARWSHFVFEHEEFDPTLMFLAMDGDEIAGVSLCRAKADDDPEMGWVGSLAVRRPWRKRGLGLALLHHSFGEFYRRGQMKVGLGVDASSLTGATRLYEKAGMHIYRQFDLYERELRPGVDLSTQQL